MAHYKLTIIIIIIIIIIILRWMKLMDNNKYKAVENMKYYFTEIVNGVNSRVLSYFLREINVVISMIN